MVKSLVLWSDALKRLVPLGPKVEPTKVSDWRIGDKGGTKTRDWGKLYGLKDVLGVGTRERERERNLPPLKINLRSGVDLDLLISPVGTYWLGCPVSLWPCP